MFFSTAHLKKLFYFFTNRVKSKQLLQISFIFGQHCSSLFEPSKKLDRTLENQARSSSSLFSTRQRLGLNFELEPRLGPSSNIEPEPSSSFYYYLYELSRAQKLSLIQPKPNYFQHTITEYKCRLERKIVKKTTKMNSWYLYLHAKCIITTVHLYFNRV